MIKRDERLGSALRELEVPEHGPGFYEELRRSLERRPAPRRAWLLAPATAVAAAVAIAVGLTLTRGSEVASAADVRAAVEHAFTSAGSISGVFVYNGTRWRFVASATGAYRISGPAPSSERVYDPAENVESNSDGSLFVRRVGLAPGPPDAGPANFVMQRGLGSVVAALAAARDPKIEEVSYAGRPAWLLRARNRLVTVDRETGVPVQDEVLRNGKVASEWRIEKLRVSSAAPAIEPLEPAPGQSAQTYDMGFRRVSLPEAQRQAGYAPLVPGRVPTGFELARVAYAKSSRSTGEEGGGNPVSNDVISLSYKRGFDEIVVTTRRTGTSPGTWKDPLQVSTVTTTKPERVGRNAYLVLEPDALPHIWALNRSLVVTIAGNVTADELRQVADSMGLR